MLPKNQRLNLKQNFKWIVSSGKKSETPSFKLLYRLGENSHPLVGVAISSKNFKKAHQRIQAKRLSFSASKEVYSTLLKNLNLVIMPRAQVLNRNIEQLSLELKNVKALYTAH